MPEDLQKKYPELFKKIPPNLIRLAFSEGTGVQIAEICRKNQLTADLKKIAYQVGLVLSGGLPPKDLREAMEEKVGLKPEIALKVSQQIHQVIFSLVKESLNKLYKEGKPLVELPEEVPEKTEISEKNILSKKFKKKKSAGSISTRAASRTEEREEMPGVREIKKDPYREPVD